MNVRLRRYIKIKDVSRKQKPAILWSLTHEILSLEPSKTGKFLGLPLKFAVKTEILSFQDPEKILFSALGDVSNKNRWRHDMKALLDLSTRSTFAGQYRSTKTFRFGLHEDVKHTPALLLLLIAMHCY